MLNVGFPLDDPSGPGGERIHRDLADRLADRQSRCKRQLLKLRTLILSLDSTMAA
jgi:hypothetical protein